MDEGNVREALSTIQKLLKTATDDEKFMIAEIYYEWGYFEEASTLLEELLIKYPNEGQLIVQLTEMYIELEEDERAIQLLNDVEEEDRKSVV